MGLDITINGSRNYRIGSYGTLHQYRSLAVLSTGDFKTFKEAFKYTYENNAWEKYPQFFHLLHFSDCEGKYLPEFFLKDVDYKKSYHLSSADMFYYELGIVKKFLSEIKSEIKEEIGWVYNKFIEFYGVLSEAKAEDEYLEITFH